MTTIHLDITPEKLDLITWEMWEKIEASDEKPSYRVAREVVSLFMVDENGAGIEQVEAKEFLAKLKTSEINAVMEQFYKRYSELTTINPTKGGS